jgi:hypothetical protein
MAPSFESWTVTVQLYCASATYPSIALQAGKADRSAVASWRSSNEAPWLLVVQLESETSGRAGWRSRRRSRSRALSSAQGGSRARTPEIRFASGDEVFAGEPSRPIRIGRSGINERRPGDGERNVFG